VNATQLVDALLEAAPIRACAACQKQFGITPQPGTSHGVCKRHAVEYWSQIMSPEEAAAHVAKKPDEQFCPDLSQQHAA